MSLRLVCALAFFGSLVFATVPSRAADALVKPLPNPDMSRIAPARANEVVKARVEFEKVRVKLVGDKLAEAYALMGSAYASNGFYDAAAVAIEDAMVLAPKDGRWVYTRGILARAQKQDAIAQNYFDLAFSLNQEYLPIRIAVVRAKLGNGDLAGARKLLADYVANHKDQALPYAMLGDISLREKHYPEAIEQTRRALAIDPSATRLYATLADAEAGAGNAKGAAEARAKAGTVEPMLLDPLGQGLLGLPVAGAAAVPADLVTGDVDAAMRGLATRDYASARQHLDTALKVRPNDSTLLALYSRVESAAGNLVAAKSRAAAAIAADPKNALGYLSQGTALEMSDDDAGAQRAYEQAVRIDEKFAEPHMLLGMLLMRNGRNDDAAVQFREVVKFDSNHGEAWVRLVAADVAAGKCATGLREVGDALAKPQHDKGLPQLFARLASTCPAATAEQKRRALNDAAIMYRDAESPVISETYALALAANGKWADAVSTQEAALFLVLRSRDRAAVPAYKQVLEQLRAHKLPERPWLASSPVFHPLRPTPDVAPAPGSTK
ncbi:MAG: tetratricopeptide repeat protein [Dokdonella sp.]